MKESREGEKRGKQGGGRKEEAINVARFTHINRRNVNNHSQYTDTKKKRRKIL